MNDMYARHHHGCEYGQVPDEPITLDRFACPACAARAGMFTELRLPGADLPRWRLDNI